ncbi:NAD(+)/NADH kinase [Halonotius pteroides]|uniref:NAD kinase n=1 Tax=Halonotius pteroides TaxID=268735 RepID=A0A3A6QNN8_9EURY|nr:NAD(+)/NADH kinase [Halonotius pteroides]RJX49960.1 NAD(+) kinase [Halonotius pteroides]
MDVGLVAQRDNSRAVSVAESIQTALTDGGVSTRLDAATAAALEEPAATANTVDNVAASSDVGVFATCDLVVSIGGDGTFLFAARAAGGAPMLGVNLGEVGFLNAVSPENAVAAVREAVEAIDAGDHTIREAPRLTARCEGFESVPAVNEIIVTGPRRGPDGGATFRVTIDGSEYTHDHADGVMIATPTGSTAYNLSENGPIVHPSIGALIVNEMCGVDGMPPLVVGGDCEVTVAVDDADHAVVVSDGRRPHEIETPAEITVSRAETPVRLVGPVADFFAALDKLS